LFAPVGCFFRYPRFLPQVGGGPRPH